MRHTCAPLSRMESSFVSFFPLGVMSMQVTSSSTIFTYSSNPRSVPTISFSDCGHGWSGTGERAIESIKTKARGDVSAWIRVCVRVGGEIKDREANEEGHELTSNFATYLHDNPHRLANILVDQRQRLDLGVAHRCRPKSHKNANPTLRGLFNSNNASFRELLKADRDILELPEGEETKPCHINRPLSKLGLKVHYRSEKVISQSSKLLLGGLRSCSPL